MQEEISTRKIRQKLDFLKTKLPKQPTAINNLYFLPGKFVLEVMKTNYSPASLQKISDHMGYYLGLLKSVKTSLWEEVTNKWVGTSDGVIFDDKNGSPMTGLYKVVSSDHSEIFLIKKYKYEIEHILAILAHEYTHNYLYHYGIRESDELENEILTELATAYLGLGHLLIEGYKPITWTDYFRHTTNSLSIGYVTPHTIRRAIIISTELRGWNPKEVIVNFTSVWDRMIVSFQLLSYIKKLKKIEKEKKKVASFIKEKEEQINSLKMDINKIQKNYNQICNLIKNIPSAINLSRITVEDGNILVEITNKISVGEILLKIENVSAKISNLKTVSSNNEDISLLVKQINELRDILSKWHTLLCKYSGEVTSGNN